MHYSHALAGDAVLSNHNYCYMSADKTWLISSPVNCAYHYLTGSTKQRWCICLFENFIQFPLCCLDKQVLKIEEKYSCVLSRWLSGKESTCQCRSPRRHGLYPWVRKTPWRGHSNPLQHSCLKNPMDRGGLQSMGSQSQTQLSNWACRHTHGCCHQFPKVTLYQPQI